MLVCLLENFLENDFDFLKKYNEKLEKTISWIGERYQEKTTKGWCSYHNHIWNYPESWATAVVLNFLVLYGKLLSKQIQNDILLLFFNFDENFLLGKPDFDDILDSELTYRDRTVSVKELIRKKIINPLTKNGDTLGVIFYGPSGSSKTTISRAIAKEIGWKYIEIPPGRFIEEGLQNIGKTTKEIFDRLFILENVVILFDEFDELVRTRERTKGEEAEMMNRFITTSMLPKIQRLGEGKNKLFIVATNHLDTFDDAIQRRGRFDILIPIYYPTYEEKLKFIEKELEDMKFVADKIKLFKKQFLTKKENIIVEKDGNKITEEYSLKDIIKNLPFLDLKSLIKEIVNLLNLPDDKRDDRYKEILKYNYSAYENSYFKKWEEDHESIEPRID